MADAGTPTTLTFWMADHRRLVRIVCIAVVLLLIASAIVQGVGGAGPFHVLVASSQALIWAGFGSQFGWGLPRRVDEWRRSRETDPAS